MRKQTKIAAVVSAAALLALGASMTSFAASKGTWMMVDGEWYCYDKNGDAYTNVFCSSNGKEYYVGDDGQLVRSEWVDYDGSYYFVNSSGAKITNDWRLTTPYDDDTADEEWYYFKSNGKRAENEKITYKGKTYYFDTDGKMLTGWVTTGDGATSVNEATGYEDGHTFYCDETGARVEGAWVKDTEPGTDDDDADADEYWYYLKKATGKPATGKQSNINGQIYLFNEEGQMQVGWVARSDSKTKNFVQLDKEDEEQDMILLSDYADSEVYYCGDEDDGHAKKNKWLKTWLPSDTEEEEDDKEWFWFDKNGKLYRADADAKSASNAQKYKLEEGNLVYDGAAEEQKVNKKKVNSKDYWSTKDGVMLSKFYLINDAMYYFGGSDDGSMKTGSQSIKDNTGDTYKFYFYTKDQAASYKTPDGNHGLSKGAGVVGNQGNKLYWYGLQIQADDYKYQVATIKINGTDYSFIVNSNGTIQHSANTEYKEDGDVLVKTGAYTQKDKDGKDVVIPTTFVKDGQAKYAIEDTKTIKKDVIDVDLGKFFQ